MPLFLKEPRYTLGCLGFFTVPRWGRRILCLGAIISLIGIGAAIMSGVAMGKGSRGFEALFLTASAWLGIFGMMRLFWTGAMWFLVLVFDWIASAIPAAAALMAFLKRAYWILVETFLCVAFLGMLIAAVLVVVGSISMDKG